MRKFLASILILLMMAGLGCTAPTGKDRPLIGITSTYNANRRDPNNVRRAGTRVGYSYVVAVQESGGIPIVLPTVSDEDALQRYVETLDGLVIIGGSDIPPDAYGQELHEKTRLMPQPRYDFESKLIPLWLESGKPILGVCLGMQFVNIAAGGTLIQDIPSMVETDIKHSGGNYHPVLIEPDSLLAQRVGAANIIRVSSVGLPGLLFTFLLLVLGAYHMVFPLIFASLMVWLEVHRTPSSSVEKLYWKLSNGGTGKHR